LNYQRKQDIITSSRPSNEIHLSTTHPHAILPKSAEAEATAAKTMKEEKRIVETK